MKFYRSFRIFHMDLDGCKHYVGIPAIKAERISNSEIEATVYFRKGIQQHIFRDTETLKCGIEEYITVVSDRAIEYHEKGYTTENGKVDELIDDMLEDGYTDEDCKKLLSEFYAIERYTEI